VAEESQTSFVGLPIKRKTPLLSCTEGFFQKEVEGVAILYYKGEKEVQSEVPSSC
jgi:hypothetical protein